MDLGLKGKTAIVTGGASNIGRAISMTLAREGCDVVIADIDEEGARKVAEKAKSEGCEGKIVPVKTDVTSLESFENCFKKTLEMFGKLDILVNNVGWDRLQLFIETTPDFWDRVINLNYKSDLITLKTVLPHMIERKYGRIVSISSDAGRVGEYREAVYSGCKAGVIALSKAVAKEVGRYNITVNVVCPSVVIPEEEETGKHSMWASPDLQKYREAKDKIAQSYPLRRLGTPQDIANAVAFLVSDAASFITGQTLSVNGGYSMM